MARHVLEGDTAGGDLSGMFPSPVVATITTALNNLPRYSSVALALSGGHVSGDYFVLTGGVLGLNTINLLAQLP